MTKFVFIEFSREDQDKIDAVWPRLEELDTYLQIRHHNRIGYNYFNRTGSLKARDADDKLRNKQCSYSWEQLSKLRKQLRAEILDENGELCKTYAANHHLVAINDGKRRQRGELHTDGIKRWEPYHRTWCTPEEFDVLNPLGELKTEWNNTTLKIGKDQGDVAGLRQLWIADGTAELMINKYGFNNNEIKLAATYSARTSK